MEIMQYYKITGNNYSSFYKNKIMTLKIWNEYHTKY